MNAFWSLYRDTAEFWTSMAQASMDTSTTLSHRLPMLTGMAPPPRNSSLNREIDRMVTEKVSAFSEGMMDAGWQVGKFYMNAVIEQPDPNAFAKAALSITKASLAPAQRAVKSNASRLSGANRRKAR